MTSSSIPLPRGQRVAIVGSGIAGLTCAWLLRKRHDVTLFEADSRIGGHTHTVDVDVDGRRYAIDTGFIVFNHWMYPNFIRLLDKLGVRSKPTDMCFGVSDETSGLEYSSRYLDGWFAQRGRLLEPAQWRTLRDLLRFSRETKRLMPTRHELRWDYSLGDFLDRGGYSRDFAERFIVPMGSAIWSAPLGELEAGGLQRRPHTITRLADLGVRQADQGKGRQAIGEMGLDHHLGRGHAVQGPGMHQGEGHRDLHWGKHRV